MPVLGLSEPEQTQQGVKIVLREVLNYAELHSQSFRSTMTSFLSVNVHTVHPWHQKTFKTTNEKSIQYLFQQNPDFLYITDAT